MNGHLERIRKEAVVVCFKSLSQYVMQRLRQMAANLCQYSLSRWTHNCVAGVLSKGPLHFVWSYGDWSSYNVSIYRSTYLSVYLFICLSCYSSIMMSIYLSVNNIYRFQNYRLGLLVEKSGWNLTWDEFLWHLHTFPAFSFPLEIRTYFWKLPNGSSTAI